MRKKTELTKQEALDIMRLHYAVAAADADLKEVRAAEQRKLAELFSKYGVKPESHLLNLDAGLFVMKEKNGGK